MTLTKKIINMKIHFLTFASSNMREPKKRLSNEIEIVQKNTTDGYTKISPFDITVKNQTSETITLKDYKIEVPNTHISLFTYLSKLLFQILILVC